MRLIHFPSDLQVAIYVPRRNVRHDSARQDDERVDTLALVLVRA